MTEHRARMERGIGAVGSVCETAATVKISSSLRLRSHIDNGVQLTRHAGVGGSCSTGSHVLRK